MIHLTVVSFSVFLWSLCCFFKNITTTWKIPSDDLGFFAVFASVSSFWSPLCFLLLYTWGSPANSSVTHTCHVWYNKHLGKSCGRAGEGWGGAFQGQAGRHSLPKTSPGFCCCCLHHCWHILSFPLLLLLQ